MPESDRSVPSLTPADSAHDGATRLPLRRSPGVRVGASIAIATGLYGISFGALGVASGLDVLQTMALSLLMFTGGSQFAFIGVVAGGGSGSAAAAAATLLGVRNSVYGMQLNAMFGPKGWRRFAGAHVTIDESTATAVGQYSMVEQRRGFWAAGLGVFGLWNLFTAVGAFAGNALGDPKQWGLDGAAVAAFLGLLWPRLRGREPVAIAVVCGLATVLAVPFVPAGVPILMAALVAAVLGWVSHSRSQARAAGGVAGVATGIGAEAGMGAEGLEPDLDPYSSHTHGRHDALGEHRRRAPEPGPAGAGEGPHAGEGEGA